VDIFQLPSQHRIHQLKPGKGDGMVMSLSVFYRRNVLHVVAGYENGFAVVTALGSDGTWLPRYRAQVHSQPILSLDVSQDRDFFITSGADATIAKHPLPGITPSPVSTVPGAASALPLPTAAELKVSGTSKSVSLLSDLLKGQPSPSLPNMPTKLEVTTDPVKVINTKHSGQQSLKIRSDDRIFATAGWDSRVRVYSTKTLKELAVLKWHQSGCYAVGLSLLSAGGSPLPQSPDNGSPSIEPSASGGTQIAARVVELSVKNKRIQQVRMAHWLAAGSKDGKVSLWDVF
jgi:ASTRA-associated protein 1